MNRTMRLGSRRGRTAARLVALAGGLAAGLIAGGAAAQGVDRYEFLELRKQFQALEGDVARLRGGAALGGRLDAVEDELQRLVGQIERLEHAQRQHEADSKQKLTDLEYRIIELEGGDPSILFQDQNESGGLAPGPAAPRAAETSPAPPQPQGGSLGVITSTATVPAGERAAFEAGAEAARAGRTTEAKQRLESFLSDNPGSALAGDAHFWLGEAYYRDGEYQAAAQRFLDGATLSPGSSTAPESLLKLGVTLGLLGKTDVACSTLREVRGRYPQAADAAARAAAEANRLGCG